MTMSLILWLSMIWMPVMMYFILANETKFKKNLAVGVTFPQKGRTDEAVVETLKRFKTVELAICAGLIAAGVVCVILRAGYVLWFVWIDAVMVAPYVAYAVYNGKLKAIKRERGWSIPAVRTASISTASVDVKWLSMWWFVPAVVLSLLPAAFDPFNWPMWVADAAVAALSFFGYRYLYRNRAEAVDENDALTQVLTRVRRRAWGQMWLICAWMMAFISLWIWLVPMLFSGSSWLEVTGIVVFAIGVTAAAISVEFRTRHVQEKLTASSGTDFYVDEDDKWIWGQLYYDPNDSRLIVNTRVGVNSTMNVAKPAGKVLLGVVVLLLVAMPLLGVWMENLATTPVKLEVTEDTLTACHGRTRYEIDMADIADVELVEQLPYMTRTNGTAMDNVLKGWFTSPWGRTRVCLDPRTGPWLHIELTDGSHYLVGSDQAAAAQTAYAVLAG